MIEVRASKFSDIKELCRTVRPKDRLESVRLGFEPSMALKYSYKNAVYRKTALVDGVVSAMWGVVGNVLSNFGVPYLVTGDAVESISPYKFARIYKHEVQQMLDLFPELENHVDKTYTESVRLLRLTGFTVEDTPGSLFNKFWIKRNN